MASSQLLRLNDGRLAYPIEDLRGSYAGAMGWGQFMPTSIAKFAQRLRRRRAYRSVEFAARHRREHRELFPGHGWEQNGPVAVRAQREDDAREVTPANGEPVYPLEQLVAWGYEPAEHFDPQRPATLLKLEGEEGTEVLDHVPQFLRDHALQPQPDVRDGGQSAGRPDRGRRRCGSGTVKPAQSVLLLAACRCSPAAARKRMRRTAGNDAPARCQHRAAKRPERARNQPRSRPSAIASPTTAARAR